MDGRKLGLQGVRNFRDYGGYVCTGGRLKRGLLYRSAQLRDATNADLARICELGLSSVIDLRGGSERSATPCRWPPGFSAKILFVDDDTTGIASLMDAARKKHPGGLSSAVLRDVIIGCYRDMPFRPSLIAILRRYLGALAERSGASLIHCMSGKDRTGLAVALFQKVMGVHYDDIMSDYMMTNEHREAETGFTDAGAHIRRAFGLELDDASVRVFLFVEPAFLEAAFAEINRRYGSCAAFLQIELGLARERIDMIAAKLVTDY